MGEVQRVTKKRDYYAESRRLRMEVITMANSLVNNPLHFVVENGITMNVEITKSDLKTIVSKMTKDNKFNAIKNSLAKDIKGFLERGKYEGWSEAKKGKHPESAYFVYYSRTFRVKAYLCVRKMKNGGHYKPYAIIDQATFNHDVGDVKKGTPT